VLYNNMDFQLTFKSSLQVVVEEVICCWLWFEPRSKQSCTLHCIIFLRQTTQNHYYSLLTVKTCDWPITMLLEAANVLFHIYTLTFLGARWQKLMEVIEDLFAITVLFVILVQNCEI